MIEEGRYIGLISVHRTCPYCEIYVEDECHFMLECPLYTDIRHKYLPNVNNNLPLNAFYILMASDNVNIIRNIAMYIYYALKDREAYLQSYL